MVDIYYINYIDICDTRKLNKRENTDMHMHGNGKWNGKTLFKQGGPFSTKAGIHRGPVSRYKLFIEITRYNI